MKNTLKQVFHSPKFVIGFVIFIVILITTIIYPIFINPGDPLEMIGLGSFAEPGTYISLYDAATTDTRTFKISDAETNRLEQVLSDDDRVSMVVWLTAVGVDCSDLDVSDTDALLEFRHDQGAAQLLFQTRRRARLPEHIRFADGHDRKRGR